MVKYENEQRMSSQAEEKYALVQAWRPDESYDAVTLELQKQVVKHFEQELKTLNVTNEEGLEMLIDAPHLLGPELGSSLSNYIKGSYSAFPKKQQILQVGDYISSDILLCTRKGDFTNLEKIVSSSGVNTIVLAGSGS